jgi:peptide/nickel transport system permease protein
MTGLKRFIREKPVGAVGGVIFMVVVFVAIFGPLLAPYDPNDTNILMRLQAPSSEFLMGTDWLGRDVLSRLIYGTRMSLAVGVGAIFLGTTMGSIIGLVSGYLGGRTDMYVQRLMDMLLAFPALILALAIMAVLGPSLINVILAISIPTIPRANRVVRSVALTVKEFQYIEAAKATGAGQLRIIIKHVLPNCMASYLIVSTAFLATAIMIEASLSFLGLGVPPPEASWGRSLSAAMEYISNAPWLIIFPGLAISAVVFAANMFGDALRDFWDPRLKRL